ncbi:MAG TPA: hypothetical protein ENJ93_05280 [Chloroflexi bacterium]|nr:hypothetical protein [Chloroflexota bacterium]
MNDKNKAIDPVPEEFTSYEEAANFWDTHDTTDYIPFLQPVEVDAQFRKRCIELEIDEDVVTALHKKAKKMGVSANRLASDLLRQQLATAN